MARQWKQNDETGHSWPYWISRDQLHGGVPSPAGPARPSWCYGTAGLARAQQLAGIAAGDQSRKQMAEHALAHALTCPRQLATITDRSLCHGYAGLMHITVRAAADASGTQLAGCPAALLSQIVPAGTEPAAVAGLILRQAAADPGFLEGAAGIALALHAARSAMQPETGWDACLLIS
jgi:hypothetical protein